MIERRQLGWIDIIANGEAGMILTAAAARSGGETDDAS
jgi:hypothetical protein